MRIPSGSTDQVLHFVAVDGTDLTTRETGLSSFTVYRKRKAGSATAWTTPTVTEASAGNMPGVYGLLIDEDTTLDSGDDEQQVVLHITQASMAPVTLTYELFRPKFTAGATLTLAAINAEADTAIADAGLTSTRAGYLDNLGVALTESYRADGATGTFTQLLYETVAHLGESSITGTTKTIKKIDGSTSAATFTLNDATTPTAITRAT